MTLTETRPAPDVGEPTEERVPAVVLPESPFTTSDHKRIGRYYIAAALLFVLVSTVVAVIMEISLTSTTTSTLEYDRLFSLHSSSVALLFLPLLFLGLATYLVPLQIGARRLAFPRVQAFAFWGTFIGGALFLLSYVFGKPNGWGLAYPTALPVAKAGASRATDLWVATLVLITLCMVLAAANLLVTVVKLRAPGMTMARVPAFTWSVFAVSVGVVLAAPVFAAGLLVLYLDQHFGAGVFAPAQRNANLVWQHTLWLYGRPDVYLVAVPALGALTDVVATHARRPLLQPVVAKGLIFATLVFSFGILAADKSIEQAVVQPTPTVLTALIAIPIGLLVLLWLGTIRPAVLRLHISLAYVFGFVALLAAGAVNAAIAPSQHLQGGLTGAGSAWTVGQVHAVMFGAPTLAAFGALYHWGPKIYGVALNGLLGALQFLCLLAGFLTMAIGQWLAGYDGAPWHVATYTGPDASTWANYAKVSSAGGVLVALGLLLFCGNAALCWARARSLPESRRPGNPYEAGTLEWGTSSPPPDDNFDSIPEVRSATPLLLDTPPVESAVGAQP
jgi:heme/copper-type cytochrome/quinol oxidase subunit 1